MGHLALFADRPASNRFPVRLELTRRADYGVRAMLALARHETDEPLSASRIAQAMAIPPRFVGQVMGDLVAAGFVEARTGRSGGYRLRKSPAEISILAIVEAMEGDSRRRTCVLRNAPCSIDGACDVHAIFKSAQDALIERLAASTLALALDDESGAVERPGQTPAPRRLAT